MVLNKQRDLYRATLSRFEAFRHVLHEIPLNNPGAPSKPFWNNLWFSTLDAASLVCFLADRKPRRYVEIGSGFSTMFARHAITSQSLPTKLTSIDPKPRSDIDRLCDDVVRMSLERCKPDIFEELEAGDMLFFDGSHRVFENSDVTVFFLEILPQLKPGVLVHIHDIFLPCDYVPRWSERLYSEQYMLAAMLLCERRPFEVVLPNYFVCTDAELVQHVEALFKAEHAGEDLPIIYNNDARIPGVSFWIETV